MSMQVSQTVCAQKKNLGNGFTVRSLSEEHFRGLIDPVLMLDHYRMSESPFEPHPHAGFSAVSYLFEDSAGGLMNYDSLGTEVPIFPGDLHWTMAGSGIVHHEPPLVPGLEVHGLQFFVNLGSTNKFIPPQPFHRRAVDMPLIEATGVRVRVVVGESGGVRAPLALPESFTMLDIRLKAGASFEHALPPGWNALVYVVDGELTLPDADADGATLTAHRAIGLHAGEEGSAVALRAVTDVHAVVMSGRPLREPIAKHGPFVMNTREQISQVIRDYTDGRMGVLAAVR